jgi:hypothetical protein
VFAGIAQDDATKDAYMSFDSFSLILTKSRGTQQEHIDLLYPLSQFALTISNDVDTTIAYRVKNNVGKVTSIVSLGTLLSSQVNISDKTVKFNELIKKIKNFNHNSLAGRMIVEDGFGQLFQMTVKNKEKFVRDYIKMLLQERTHESVAMLFIAGQVSQDGVYVVSYFGVVNRLVMEKCTIRTCSRQCFQL